MSIALGVIIFYFAYGLPVAIMFNRAGSTWAWSLFVLIPLIGLPIALLVLINRDWQVRRRA